MKSNCKNCKNYKSFESWCGKGHLHILRPKNTACYDFELNRMRKLWSRIKAICFLRLGGG